jgi:hypothetical protein
MKKIVIFADNSDHSFSRLPMLNALFPDCEIEIRQVIPDEEDLQYIPFSSLSKISPIDESES